MKIKGHSRVKVRTKEVELGKLEEYGEVLTITLRAPRLNEIEAIDAELTEPAAPQAPAGDPMRDSRNRLVKDEEGRVITTRKTNDPGYLKKMAEHAELVARIGRAKTVGLLLACMSDVKLETNRDDYTDGNGGAGEKGTLVDYYDAVWKEFEDFNLDLVTITKLINTAQSLAGLSDEEIDSAQESLGLGKG